jgi:hypothetical protein
MRKQAMQGDINPSLIWNHKDRENREGMRSRFLRGGGLRPLRRTYCLLTFT